MTTAIVLAAGLGRRLQLPDDVPKWLAPVGDGCPADVQLSALAELAGVEEVLVVVGPGADLVEAHVAPWRARLSIRLLPNPCHDSLNNWYSLLLPLREHLTGDVLVLNSDLYAAPAWLADTARHLVSCGAPAALAIDRERPIVDEAMKVAIDARDEVQRIGKRGVDDPRGEYVGMSWWTEDAAAVLRDHLEAYVGVDAARDNWYEHGIDDDLRSGGRYLAVRVPSVDWVEIDDPGDLAIALRLATGPEGS